MPALLLGFILGAATIIFALQNPAIVSLTFLQWGFQSSLAMLILLATGVGILLGILFSIPGMLRRGAAIRTLRRENRQLAKQADDLEKWNAETVAHYETFGATQPAPAMEHRVEV
jgi:lipopolysaccharide assembly protein A